MAKTNCHGRVQRHQSWRQLSPAPSVGGLQAAIGVFDSGIGGLSVLKALRAEMPQERFIYWADSGYVPYGERSDDFVIARGHDITEQLMAKGPLKAVVVACNTATAVAIESLRTHYSDLPFIGVEPALKPALAQTKFCARNFTKPGWP